MSFFRRPKGSKYGNIRVEVDGIKFHSKKEAKRYLVLKQDEADGLITNLKLQPRYPFVIEGVKVCTYIADFSYDAGGVSFVEDVKGMKTDIYKLKRKLFLVLYPHLTHIES